MRISDWSSDVCSSDLSPFLRHPIVTANGIASLHAMSSGRAMLGFASGGSSVMSIGREPATLAQMAREITTFRDLFAGRGSEFEGREVKPLRYPRNVRSEEHTSELQSLMRSAYAVICL